MGIETPTWNERMRGGEVVLGSHALFASSGTESTIKINAPQTHCAH